MFMMQIVLRMLLYKLLGVLFLFSAYAAEKEWSMTDFEELRNGLPVDEGVFPERMMRTYRGILVSLPNKRICMFEHLNQIGIRIKLTEESSLKMLTYLRDKDLHMQMLAMIALNNYLSADEGYSGLSWSEAQCVVFVSQPPQGPIGEDEETRKQIRKNYNTFINELLDSFANHLKLRHPH